jgi:hypothetical protein
MDKRHPVLPLCVWALVVVGLGLPRAASAAVVEDEDASQQVVVRNVSESADGISGVLLNRSNKIVRDVKLLIRHSWVWSHERKPGEESPGESYFTTVPNDIPAGSSVRFTYRPRGGVMGDESGGHFDTSVDVVGYTEVTMPGERADHVDQAPGGRLTVEPPSGDRDGGYRGGDPRSAPGLPSDAPPSTRRVDPF